MSHDIASIVSNVINGQTGVGQGNTDQHIEWRPHRHVAVCLLRVDRKYIRRPGGGQRLLCAACVYIWYEKHYMDPRLNLTCSQPAAEICSDSTRTLTPIDDGSYLVRRSGAAVCVWAWAWAWGYGAFVVGTSMRRAA